MIAFFYLFNLFKSLLIIPISCNSFKYDGDKNLEIIVNIDPESMQVTVFFDISPDIAV